MSQNKLTFKGLLIWNICAVFFSYEFLLRTVLGTFEISVTHDLYLTPLSFAILSSSAYQMVYGLMQVPVSAILGRFGLRTGMTAASLTCAVGIGLFSWTNHLPSALAFRILTGLGASFGFIGLLIVVYEWMPKSKTAFFIGMSQFVGTLGPMTAAGPLEFVTQQYHLSWRNIHVFLSIAGLLLSVLIFLFVRNKKVKIGKFQVIKKPEPAPESLKKILTNAQVLSIALFSAFSFFSIEFLSENAGKHYLVLAGYKATFASSMISIAWLSYAIGCPLLGIISDLTKKRRSTMIFSSVASMLAVLLITFLPMYKLAIVAGFLLLGLGSSGQSIGFVIIAEQLSANFTALSLGFNNAVMGLFTSINSPVVGAVLYFLAGNSPKLLDYQQAFLILIGITLGGLGLSLFVIKETFCKSNSDLHVLSID